MLSIGLMSGTSMDGIDAALIETDGLYQIKELDSYSYDYHPLFSLLLKISEFAVRQTAEQLLAAHPQVKQGDLLNKVEEHFDRFIDAYLTLSLNLSAAEIAPKKKQLLNYLQQAHPHINTINFQTIISHSTFLHGQAALQLLQQTSYQPQQIDLLGCHGQTFFHKPAAGLSIILCHAKALAQQTGIAVVADFRQQDIAAGGQGAPFAPLYHQALAVRDRKIPCAVVNCGGISNITIISDEQPENLLGFDCGPGNGLIDRLVRQRTQGQESMDKDGLYGAKGKVSPAALTALFQKAILINEQNYFKLLPPKALDINDMQLPVEIDNLSLEDACATLEAFTAACIVDSLSLISTTLPTHWILAGGGWFNPLILKELNERLSRRIGKQLKIETADAAGWNGKALEAQIFAYLAVRSVLKLPLSVPGTTRVPKPTLGGRLYQP